MNILFIKQFFLGFIVSEISRVSVFGYFPLYHLPMLSPFVVKVYLLGYFQLLPKILRMKYRIISNEFVKLMNNL